jgi:hypothetical protein
MKITKKTFKKQHNKIKRKQNIRKVISERERKTTPRFLLNKKK